MTHGANRSMAALRNWTIFVPAQFSKTQVYAKQRESCMTVYATETLGYVEQRTIKKMNLKVRPVKVHPVKTQILMNRFECSM